jgi:hypothetical protein
MAHYAFLDENNMVKTGNHIMALFVDKSVGKLLITPTSARITLVSVLLMMQT